MAEIKMDISEYELLKENKKLLEESLKKERELQATIDKLSKEKIKALEDAKMKVIKIVRNESTEYLMQKRDNYHVVHQLRMMLSRPDSSGYRTIDSMNFQDFGDMLFEKVKSYSIEPKEEITTCGLDEVKAEIRKDLESKIDSNTKKKLDDADVALTKLSELLKENDESLKLIKTLNYTINELTKVNENAVKEINILKKELVENKGEFLTVVNLIGVLKDGYTFWNKSKLLDEIIKILKDRHRNEN